MPRRKKTNTGESGANQRAGSQVEPGPFETHQSALAYLNSCVNFERVRTQTIKPESFKLIRMQALVKELGDPHMAVPCVHIAGSKGKGSTCVMLESCLRSSGYTTGLYTSPHLIDERERVRINGSKIDESSFDEALALCKDAAINIAQEHGQATYFEMMTALAFVVFAQQAVDLVILETGLGGRLDCTNVAQPVVVGLTSIQLEHTDVLGTTLVEIAKEKAGIMKPGGAALSVPQSEEVIEAFRSIAEQTGCTLSVLDDEILYSSRFQSATRRGPHPKVCVGQGDGCFEHMSVPLLGEHQAQNCGLSLAIILELRKHGFDLPEHQVIMGLENTPRDGRLEQVNDHPRVLVDGAHTPESVRETLKAVAQQLEFDSLVVVFGCNNDKRCKEMIKELKTRADKVIFTRAQSNSRSTDPQDLGRQYTEISSKSCESYTDPTSAIRAAGKSLGSNDLLLVLGSFYLAGEVKSLFNAKAMASK